MLEGYICLIFKPKLNVLGCLLYLSLLPKPRILCKSKQNIKLLCRETSLSIDSNLWNVDSFHFLGRS